MQAGAGSARWLVAAGSLLRRRASPATARVAALARGSCPPAPRTPCSAPCGGDPGAAWPAWPCGVRWASPGTRTSPRLGLAVPSTFRSDRSRLLGRPVSCPARQPLATAGARADWIPLRLGSRSSRSQKPCLSGGRGRPAAPAALRGSGRGRPPYPWGEPGLLGVPGGDGRAGSSGRPRPPPAGVHAWAAHRTARRRPDAACRGYRFRHFPRLACLAVHPGPRRTPLQAGRRRACLLGTPRYRLRRLSLLPRRSAGPLPRPGGLPVPDRLALGGSSVPSSRRPLRGESATTRPVVGGRT